MVERDPAHHVRKMVDVGMRFEKVKLFGLEFALYALSFTWNGEPASNKIDEIMSIDPGRYMNILGLSQPQRTYQHVITSVASDNFKPYYSLVDVDNDEAKTKVYVASYDPQELVDNAPLGLKCYILRDAIASNVDMRGPTFSDIIPDKQRAGYMLLPGTSMRYPLKVGPRSVPDLQRNVKLSEVITNGQVDIAKAIRMIQEDQRRVEQIINSPEWSERKANNLKRLQRSIRKNIDHG